MRDQLEVASAISDARTWALARAGFPDASAADPDSVFRESIAQLAPLAPSVATAAGLLSSAAVPPVPIARQSLRPTAEPLASLAAIDEHYRRNPSDGCAVPAGVQPNGAVVFALRGPVAALRAWLADLGTEQRSDEHGRITKSYKPTPPYVTVKWAPPPVAARAVVSYGADIDTAHRHLVGDRDRQADADALTGWLVWTTACVFTVAPQSGDGPGVRRQLWLKTKKLEHGVTVVADGLIPWHVRRGDGWVCAASTAPIAPDEPLPGWLADAIGAKWRAA